MSCRLPLALRASSRPWAVASGVRGAIAAGLIAGFGVLTGQMAAVGLMYFGAACSVAFATGVTARIRLVGVASQATGAAVGLVIGALSAPNPAVMVVAVAAAAFCSGAAGRIGPQSAAGATMLVIGVAFAQFSGIDLPWFAQIAWYCTGSAIVGIATLPVSGFGRFREERAAIAKVFGAAADLMAAVGTPSAGESRTRLAAASADARSAWYDNRFRATFEGGPRYRDLARQLRTAQTVALIAASMYRDRARPAAATVDAVRAQARRLFAWVSSKEPDGAGISPELVSLLRRTVDGAAGSSSPIHHAQPRSILSGLTSAPSLLAGIRLAICMTVATGVTLLLHDPAHSFWLPLTVAVVVRPEYASVYVRTLNRMVGTLIGATLATVPLLIFGSGWPIAICAALAVGFAAAAAPKLYGLSVIGITCSALLSTSIAVADPVAPIFRLLDTLLGCVIAMIFGYLLWPKRYSSADGLDSSRAVNAATAYLQAIERADATPQAHQEMISARDRAYRSAHLFRSAAQSTMADPPPTRRTGAAALPVAVHLEEIVDDITALAEKCAEQNTNPQPDGVRRIREQLEKLG